MAREDDESSWEGRPDGVSGSEKSREEKERGKGGRKRREEKERGRIPGSNKLDKLPSFIS